MNFKQYAQDNLNSQHLPSSAGGKSVYDLSINSFMLVMAQNLRKYLNRNVRFHLGFLSNSGRNAYADEQDGAYFLSMHTDMFQGFLEFCNFCFSQREFLTGIGQHQKETSPTADENFVRGIGLFSVQKEIRSDRIISSGRQMPHCTTRAIAAIHMAHMMARFVWLHEFAHCFRGHVKLVQNEDMGQRLSEALPAIGVAGFPSRNSYSDHHETFQLIEIDADYWAMEAMLRVQLGGTEPIKVLAKKDINNRFMLSLFAIVTVCWMFEEFHKGLEDPNHPSNDLRQALLMVHLSRFVRQHCKDAMPLLVHTYKQFEIIKNAIPGFHDLRALHHLVKSKEMVEQINERNGALLRFRERLVPFT